MFRENQVAATVSPNRVRTSMIQSKRIDGAFTT